MVSLSVDVLSELKRFYKTIDIQPEHPMTDEQIDNYHQYLINNNAIRFIFKDERLIAYVTFFKINYEQFGRLVCQIPFNATKEDIVSGNICYCMDVTIDPEFRNTEVMKHLKNLFFEGACGCEHFVGHAIYKKRSQPIRVFRGAEILKKYLKGANHG